MNRTLLCLLAPLVAGLFLAGCNQDGRNRGAVTAAPVASSSAPVQSDRVTFEIVIENLSGDTSLASPFAPAGWALHNDSTQAFWGGGLAGPGLESLAEDGDPSALLRSLDLNPGVVATGQSGPTLPGGRQVFQVQASRAARSRLSLATMLVASNDGFYALPEAGLELFDAQGQPLPSRVLTPGLYDAGTEANEALGAGRHQPGRQVAANTGPGEAVVSLFSAGTRLVPRAERLVEISVSESAGELVISLRNRSAEAGFATPIAPLFYTLHQDGYTLFQDGASAPRGLETLAEDGSPAALVAAVGADPLVGMAGAQTTTLQRPNAGPGAALPGETFELRLDTAGAERLSLAAMLVQTNDWFLALPPTGLSLRDATGALRSATDLEAELRRTLTIWDAGTEANQVPGAGSFQPMRQTAGNTGPLDADDTVRLALDLGSDLEGRGAGGVAQVTVTPLGGARFQVEVTNTTNLTSYGAVLTPVAWSLGSGQTTFFEAGRPASPGLESLAEDGSPAGLVASFGASANAGAANTPVGAAGPGPIAAGQSYRFEVTASAAERYLNLATMVVPSNDVFLALGERGVALLDATGAPRSAAAIQTEIGAALSAWDAGTEANETGAAGPNQPPAQAGPNTGQTSGNGLVRPYDDALFTPPTADRMIRITIRPLGR